MQNNTTFVLWYFTILMRCLHILSSLKTTGYFGESTLVECVIASYGEIHEINAHFDFSSQFIFI